MDVEHLDVVLGGKLGGLERAAAAADGIYDRLEAKAIRVGRASSRAFGSVNTLGMGVGRSVGGIRAAEQAHQRGTIAVNSYGKAHEDAAKKIKHAERTAGREGRGFLAGSGLLRGGGRALAFGSGAFLGGAVAAMGVRDVIEAAKGAQESKAALRLAAEDSGVSWLRYGRVLDQVVVKQERLSAFSRGDLRNSLGTLLRATGDANKATADMGLAENVARGRHISLAAATTMVVRAQSGMIGRFRQIFPQFQAVKTAENALTDSHKHFSAETKAAAKALDQHATAAKLLGLIHQKYKGAAGDFAGTGAGKTEAFSHSVTDLEANIGSGLMPVLSKYLGQLSTWIQKMDKSGKLQKDVSGFVRGSVTVIKMAASAVRFFAGVVRLASGAVGGFKNLLTLVAAVAFAAKVSAWTSGLRTFGAMAGTAGGAGKVGGLLAKVRALGRIGMLSLAFRYPGLASGLSRVAMLGGALTKLTSAPYLITFAIVAIGAKKIADKIKSLQKGEIAAESHVAGQNSGVRRALVPKLASEITKMRGEGMGGAAIIAALRQQLGGNTDIANQLIADAYSYRAGQGTKTQVDALVRRHKKAVEAAGKADKAGKKPLTAAEQAAADQKKMDAEIKKLLGTGTGSKTTKKVKLPPVLPFANQTALEKALGLEETNRLAGARAVVNAARQGLAVLNAEHATGKRLVELESKRRELLRDINSAEKTVTVELKKQEQAKIAARERKILGITLGDQTPGKLALVRSEHRVLAGALARAGVSKGSLVGKTNAQLLAEMRQMGIALPKSTEDSIAKINRVFREKFLPPDVRDNIKARLQQIEQTLKDSAGRMVSNLKPVHSTDIVKGLGLSGAQAKAVEMRIAQAAAHKGMAPTGIAVAGVPLGANGQPAQINVTVHGDTHDAKKLAKKLAEHMRNELEKHHGRNARHVGG